MTLSCFTCPERGSIFSAPKKSWRALTKSGSAFRPWALAPRGNKSANIKAPNTTVQIPFITILLSVKTTMSLGQRQINHLPSLKHKTCPACHIPCKLAGVYSVVIFAVAIGSDRAETEVAKFLQPHPRVHFS